MRPLCNEVQYEETMFDAFFEQIQKEEELPVQLLISLTKSCKECRYNKPHVQHYLFKQTMRHIDLGIQTTDEALVFYMLAHFARFGNREAYEALCAKIDFNNIVVAENILSALKAMAYLQDYNHERYQALLIKLMRFKHTISQLNYRIFNHSLCVVLMDYSEFGCAQDPKAKAFALECQETLVDSQLLAININLPKISKMHKMFYFMLTSELINY